jgi:hypothetical protein
MASKETTAAPAFRKLQESAVVWLKEYAIGAAGLDVVTRANTSQPKREYLLKKELQQVEP